MAIKPWDALRGTSVYYTYTGSKQSLENSLVITDTFTNQIVYSFENVTLEKVHHIPPNVLKNGKSYSAKLRVKLADDTFSPYSNSVNFKCFKTPVIDISNIDGKGYVYNSDVTFIANYHQEDGERIKNYRFSLYDENEELIKNFPVRTPTDFNYLTETVNGLEKSKSYFIKCSIETINGVTYSHREMFTPLYIVPSIKGIINARNDEEEGFIRVTANLKQIIGTQVSGGDSINPDIEDLEQVVESFEYIENEWVVVPKDKSLFFTGLSMNRASDYIMKVWFKDVPNNTRFLELSPPRSTGIAVQFWKYKDRVVAIKDYNGVRSIHVSNIIEIPNNYDCMLYVKAIEHRIELEIEVIK